MLPFSELQMSVEQFNPSDPVAQEFLDAALVHRAAVFRMACCLSRDRSVAEDLTQETFLQAWRSFARFQRGSNCRAWLHGILYFVWSHERRRRGREPVLFDSAMLDTQVLIYDPPTPDRLTDEDVLHAFEKLPQSLQEIVLLADVEGLTYREVASVLSIPLGTVMSRLNRGRRLLRSALVECAGGHGIEWETGEPLGGEIAHAKAKP